MNDLDFTIAGESSIDKISIDIKKIISKFT